MLRREGTSNYFRTIILSLCAQHDEVRAEDVVSADDEVGSQMTLIPVEEGGGRGDVAADSGLPAGVEPLEFKIGGHEEVDELGIGCGSGSACVDIGGNVVYFLAVLFNDDGSSGGPGIGSKDDSVSKFASDNGGSCFFMGHGLDDIFVLKHLVSGYVRSYLWVLVKSKPPICYE